MTLVTVFPAALALGGRLVYLLFSVEPYAAKMSRVGWVCFVVGLAVFTFTIASHVVKL